MRTLLFARDPHADAGVTTGAGDKAAESTPAEIETLRAELAKLRDADAARAAAEKAAEDAEAVKRGEAEKLLAARDQELAAAKERLAAFEARETARVQALEKANAERVKALPAAFADLLPAGLDADAAAAFLGKLEAAAGSDVARGTRRGTHTDEPIPEACTAEWKLHSKGTLSERDWFNNVWKPRQKAGKEARN